MLEVYTVLPQSVDILEQVCSGLRKVESTRCLDGDGNFDGCGR